MTTPADPTGRRFVLRDGAATAEIAQVGAALRALRVDGVDLVPTYPSDIPAPAASGTVLVPWPNRVRGGAWTQNGTTRQLAITEPARGNASHGLLRFAPYTPIAQDDDSISLGATVFPQTGYPFHLETSVTYSLRGRELRVRHTILNVGAEPAPVAVGAHPYFCISDVPTADLTIELDAATRFVVDDAAIPIAEAPVDEATDLRLPRRLGDLDLDTAYLPGRAPDGTIRATLRAPDGRSLRLSADEAFGYLQVFTTTRYPGHELAVAIEPMTAPADAFNSGRSLRWLEPDRRWNVEWSVLYTE